MLRKKTSPSHPSVNVLRDSELQMQKFVVGCQIQLSIKTHRLMTFWRIRLKSFVSGFFIMLLQELREIKSFGRCINLKTRRRELGTCQHFPSFEAVKLSLGVPRLVESRVQGEYFHSTLCKSALWTGEDNNSVQHSDSFSSLAHSVFIAGNRKDFFPSLRK